MKSAPCGFSNRARVVTGLLAVILSGPVYTVATSARGEVPSSPRSVDDGRASFGPARPVLHTPLVQAEPVLAGIDVLRAEAFARLKGKRVGLLTNQTGRARDGTSTIDLIHRAPGVTLVALFSPEHGIRGTLDQDVPSTEDEATGVVIHSLFGDRQRPTAQMLDGLDTVVVDLQDIGARFYTYVTTMAYVMEEAAKHEVSVTVLDRPNPINGDRIEGPTITPDLLGFVGYYPMPIRHGMTIGEMARLFRGENKLDVELDVVPLKGWRRDDWYDETGLAWVNPSPNMRNLIQATVFPGIGAIEYSNISVGRGTDTPFEQIGAPWIDGVTLAAELNAHGLAGIRFYPVSFTPEASKYAGQPCQGVFLLVTDRLALRPVEVGVVVASVLTRLYPREYDLQGVERLLGSRDVVARIRAGEDPAHIAQTWAADEARWRLFRSRYLLY